MTVISPIRRVAFSTIDDSLANGVPTPLAIFIAGAAESRGGRVASLPNLAVGHGPPLRPAPSRWYPGTLDGAEPILLPSVAQFGGRAGWKMDKSRLETPLDLAGQRGAASSSRGSRPVRAPWSTGRRRRARRSGASRAGRVAGICGSGPMLTLGSAPDHTRAHVYAMCFDGGAATLFVDGGQVASGRVASERLPAWRPEEGRGFPPAMSVGFDPAYNDAAGVGYATGLLGSIVVTIGSWTAADVARVSAELALTPSRDTKGRSR